MDILHLIRMEGLVLKFICGEQKEVGPIWVMMVEVGTGESGGEKIPQVVYENEWSTLFKSDRLV